MWNKPKNLKENWKEYIELYEDLKQKSIPENLKTLTNDIRKIIKEDVEKNTSFKIFIDIHNLKINLNVVFKINDEKSVYYSNLDIYDVIKKDFLDLTISVEDKKINLNDLMSVINHELRHVYDIITLNDEYDTKSFEDVLKHNTLNKDNLIFNNFINCIYLSFEHELIARNCMIYDKFIGVDKSLIYKYFEKSYIYEALMILKDFNTMRFIMAFDLTELIKLTNNFNKIMNKNFIVNKDSIIPYFKKWEEFFKQKSSEYLEEAYKMIDITIKSELNENQEFNPYDSYPSYKDKLFITLIEEYDKKFKTLFGNDTINI